MVYHLHWISTNPGSYIPLPLSQIFGNRRYRPCIVLLPAACDAQNPPEGKIKGNDHYLYIFTWYVGTESKKMNITMQYAFETIQPD